MAKKTETSGVPRKGKMVRGVATTAEILFGFAPKPSRSLINAFSGDVDAARSLRLDSAHFGELQT